LAFQTVTGSNGITSLVGSTKADAATLATLDKDVFIGGNTGDDIITTALGTGGNNLSNYDVRMGGGDDSFTLGNQLLNSFIELDGTTTSADGDDTFAGASNLIISSEIRGMAGDDTIGGARLNQATVNGNTGQDTLTFTTSSNSEVYGGQGSDIITNIAGAATNSTDMYLNGNKGVDRITLLAAGFTGEIYGGQEGDILDADLVTTATGGALKTKATGITLSGDKGADSIVGSDGSDAIFGGEDADTLKGGTGRDTLTGGAGGDLFNIDNTGGGIIASGESVGYITFADLSANTGSGGDTIDTGVAGAAIGNFEEVGNYTSTTSSLSGDLAAGVGVALDAVGDISTITIAAGKSWSGSYMVVSNNTIAGYDAADSVYKMNTLAGVTAANEANLFV